MKYTLLEPVKLGDKVVTEVTLRKPKMGDLNGINLSQLGTKEFGIIFGRIAEGNLTTYFFEQLSWQDGFKISEMITDFLPNSLQTGKTAPAS